MKELRRALAHPGRGERALAGIEGPNLLEEALRAGLRLECVFVAQGSERLIDDLSFPAETEILLLPKPLLDAALATETPQAVAALVETPDWTWAHLASVHAKSAPLLVLLAALQDPGNLGTILRSAEAFGASGILALPGTVSAWNPKAVRASAGSVFRVPLLSVSPEECFTRLREAGIRTFATTVHAAQPAHLVPLAAPAALLIGNEGNGVPESLAAHADGSITIPCPGPVESLNAAVAASVLLYEASRQRTVLSASARPHRGSAQ